MARLILLDDERRTYPPASAHRRHDVHNPNWAHVAVWTGVTASAVGMMYVAVRTVIVFYEFVTLHWMR